MFPFILKLIRLGHIKNSKASPWRGLCIIAAIYLEDTQRHLFLYILAMKILHLKISGIKIA